MLLNRIESCPLCRMAAMTPKRRESEPSVGCFTDPVADITAKLFARAASKRRENVVS
jgi:hypothetical protein